MKARTKKRVLRFTVVSTILLILAIAGWMFFQWLTYRKAKFTRYPEFGIAIPEAYEIHGIDVSRYQQTIAWEEVRAMRVKDIQLGFCFIKATEGIGNTDPQFRRNWRKAKENGIVRGAYHFFIGSKDGKMQAENFIDRVDLQPGDLPPVLDVEQLNGANAVQLKKEVKEWLDVVEAYYNVKPILYTNIDFYKRNLGSDFDNYPLWVAHYYEHKQPRIQRGWIFWQHNDQGNVNGIISRVDFNVFSGDSLEFRSLLVR
ncbi:MAG TPA: GH25 family lysozyme [Chitinophagaceae bacterium]